MGSFFCVRRYDMHRKTRRNITNVVLLAITICSLFLSQSPFQSVQKQGELTPVIVTRVVDGDTICVMEQGQEIKVRMIGVNTPESVSPQGYKNTPEGVVASQYTKEQLYVGRQIYLERGREKQDKYGRTLAYIWLEKGVNCLDYTSFCNYNYGAILMKNTYCEAVYYSPNGKYKTWYETLEQQYQK